MKRVAKKLTSAFLAVVFLLVTVLGVIPPQVAQAAGTTLIIHYGGREDGNYDGWNLWVWEDGKDGQSITFKAEDSFGKIAVYQTSNQPEKVGFIVRLNDWEDKDISDDRMIEMKSGVTEIWVTSGQAEFVYEAPEGCSSYDFEGMEKERLELYDKADSLKVNVHYYNYDESYDTTEALAWKSKAAPGSYPLVETDAYGAVYHIGLAGEDKEGELGFTIYNDGNADSTKDRTVDLSKASGNVLDVYTVEGKSDVWYSAEEVDKTPAILTAEFSQGTTKQIDVTLSQTIDTADENTYTKFKVTDETGTSYKVHHIWNENPGVLKSTKVVLDEPVSLSHTYTITYDNWHACDVDITGAFSSESFEEEYAYDGDDLGAIYTKEKTNFRLWAPTASKVELNLYEAGSGDCLIETVPMTADEKGTWVYEKAGDMNGVYYTYNVTVGGETNEAVDPYAKAAGVNGKRGMVIDLDSTDPEGFESDTRPEFKNMTDAVIYELHVRDLSADSSSGITNTGKFLGLTETGTKNSEGISTGLDHMKDLGVTHVHLLPSFDYASVDESSSDSQFNWGYDPQNYNVPEGSYSTDASDGSVRVEEYKEMVQTLHENGIRVIMDVVYNHTFSSEDSNFQKVVPDYYYRKNGEAFSNASGCGNETASERAMVRKYMVDSVVYWATEYHVDGFRFDLMGIHDIETMNAIREALDEVDPSIIIYGEGWTSGDSTLDSTQRALKANTKNLTNIAAFSDDIRDALKGNVFDALDKGFVSGKEGMENDIKYSVVGSTENEQVDYDAYEKSNGAWSPSPSQTINYVSCHDNYTLWDKLATSNPEDSVEDRIKMNNLASAIVFTSQGIPFIQAGEEMLRSKPLEDGTYSSNSYNLSDKVNSLKWDDLSKYQEVYNYYKGLIAFRKSHGAFRMTSTEEVQNNLKFVDGLDANVVAYTIDNSPNGETAESVFVVYNANKEAVSVTLPEGNWDVYVNGEKAGTEVLDTVSGKVEVSGISAMVLTKGNAPASAVSNGDAASASSTIGNIVPIAVGAFVIVIIALAVVYAVFFKKKK